MAQGLASFTPGYAVKVSISGTDVGYSQFCSDQTDIQEALRPMNPGEVAACLHSGIDYLQIILGYDVLALIGDARIGGCISSTELTYIYTHNNLTWDTVREGLPAQPVKVFGPSAQTSAAQFFAERVLSGKLIAVPDVQQLIAKGSGIGYI